MATFDDANLTGKNRQAPACGIQIGLDASLPLDDLIISLDPETRCDFDRLRFGLAFDGVSSGQAAAMAIAYGYLAQVLSGKRPFERTEAVLFLMPLVELLELHDDQERDRKTKKTD